MNTPLRMKLFKFKIHLLFCAVTLFACKGNNRDIGGFTKASNQPDPNYYLKYYPKEIDSVIRDTFERTYNDSMKICTIDSIKTYYAWVISYTGSSKREFLDTNEYNVRTYFRLGSEEHYASFILSKKIKIKMAFFP